MVTRLVYVYYGNPYWKDTLYIHQTHVFSTHWSQVMRQKVTIGSAMEWNTDCTLILKWIWNVIGIDHDTVCAGVGGTAIRHSTSCAGRRAAACGRHNECCAWWQYHPRQRRPYKWSISILPRSQFYKRQGKLAFSTSCTAVRPHRRLRNDAWRRDS